MAEKKYEPTPFGKEMLKHFSFGPGYRNLNHGSYGTSPIAIRTKAVELRDYCETRPCPFIRFEFPKLLDESRQALAQFLNVPVSRIVLVPNATTGVNTVLRNLVWNPDGKDEILQFNIIYGACGKTTDYLCESNNDIVSIRGIHLQYPIEDEEIISLFRAAICESRASGHRPRIAIFDTVSSNPGVRMPFEDLTSVCRSESILSLIDAAHGIGHVDLNLATLDPDFLVSNCHKWLYTPRGCAVFYVPERNQAMMRSTLPTSHGFVKRARGDLSKSKSSRQTSSPNRQNKEFVDNFAFAGTVDSIPYLTIPEAIKWRKEVCGGEEKIRTYCRNLAREGGAKVAEILGTCVLDNKQHTITNCCLINVRLPLSVNATTERDVAYRSTFEDRWIKTLVADYKTFLPLFFFQGAWWARLSGQVYLDMSDFVWAGETLKELCARVEEGEFSDLTTDDEYNV